MKFNYSSANIAVPLDRAGGPPFLHLDDSVFVGLMPISLLPKWAGTCTIAHLGSFASDLRIYPLASNTTITLYVKSVACLAS